VALKGKIVSTCKRDSDRRRGDCEIRRNARYLEKPTYGQEKNQSPKENKALKEKRF